MSLNHLLSRSIPIGAVIAIFGSAANAQDQEKSWKYWDEKNWQFFVGAGVDYSPEFEGSDKFETSPGFGFEAVWRDRFVISPDGLGAFIVNEENYSVFFGLGYGGGREERDSDYLRGLGTIDNGAVFSLGGQYDLGFAAATIDVTKFAKGSQGTLVSLGLQSDVPFGVLTGTLIRTGTNISDLENDRGWVFTGGVSLDWADSNYNQSFFGVTSAQSASSGLRQFSAGSGLKSANATIGVSKILGPNWGVTGEVTYSRLLGDAADSPITRKESSLTYSLSVGFDF